MWLYRLLLKLYPSRFRAEYEQEMSALFVERRRAANSARDVLALWLEALSDVIWNGVPMHVDALRQDLRYALRGVRRAPTFSLTVVIVAALGIGANTAVFTVADLVLVRPLPFTAPDRLVRIWQSPPGYSRMEASPPNYQDWVARSTSFEVIGAYNRFLSANLVGSGEPVRLEGAAFTAEVLDVLGVQPLIGRGFTQADDVQGAPGTLLLSHATWQNHFGGDPAVLGERIILDDQPYAVIGVMPPDFQFPTRRTQYWATLRLGASGEDRADNYLEVIARLAPGVSIERARAEMSGIMARLETEFPAENEDHGATVNLVRDEVPDQTRLLIMALAGSALGILLIACTNLANLMLARSITRRHELAVRSSLGAGRDRLVGQMLTESLLLAGLGGILGVVLAVLTLPLMARLVPESLPVSGDLALDGRMLLFAAIATMVTGIGFGAWPAFRAGNTSAAQRLRASSRGAMGGRGENLRRALVIVEVTTAVVLLIASGLLIRSLVQVRAVDPGFDTDGVLTMRTSLPFPRYALVEDRNAFHSRVLDEVRALPSVSSAAYTSFLPIVMGGGIWPVEMNSQQRSRSDSETASLRFITPTYFATLGIRIRQGRDVSEFDTREQPFVAVVSESFVERYWPGLDPLGRTFTFAFAERTVVGVVDDVKVRGLERASEPQVYLPHTQVADSALIGYTPKDLAVKANGDLMQLVPAIREIIRKADPSQPVTSIQSLAEIVSSNTASRRVQLRMVGALATLAFVLAALGIHGLLSFTTTQRGREIGLRMALGAEKPSVLWMVLREGVILGGIGVAVGSVLGLAAASAMQALLFGVPATDPFTFASALAIALSMTMAGSLPPALRAASVDPADVLRGA